MAYYLTRNCEVGTWVDLLCLECGNNPRGYYGRIPVRCRKCGGLLVNKKKELNIK